MKQKTRNGKFTIEIKDGYLEGGKYTRKDGTAVIKLFTEESSVTLDEVADAIISCTFWGSGFDRIIDSNRFHQLDIYLEIKKSKDTGLTYSIEKFEPICVTYNFKIPRYRSTSDVLPAIARNIRI